MTADLLQLAKAESATHPFEPVDLGDILPDVVETFRSAAEAGDLALTCELHGDLNLVGDTDALIRLFLNLIDNAIKYTESGGVTVSGEGSGHDVVVRVSDTGEGISAEHLPHVFERFYRVDESRTAPGTGLGLPICREIVDAHHGDITVTSRPGSGSTFTVTLPRA
jgi:signal transduction histidine kinase